MTSVSVDDLCAVAENEGVRVCYTGKLPTQAAWDCEQRIIWLRTGQREREEIANLAHELGHAILGHEHRQDLWAEACADEVAALLLINETEYVEAERLYGEHPAAIADALELPVWVVETRRKTLLNLRASRYAVPVSECI